MIVTAEPKVEHAYRVRVFERNPWKLVGDSSFASDFGDDFRRYSVRLAGDGRSYYYIDGTLAPTLRDAVSGQEMPLGYLLPPGGIDDMLLYSESSGFAVANNKLYALGQNHAVNLIPVSGGQHVESLVETADHRLQAVRFSYGWGMFDMVANRWLKVSNDPVSSVHSQGAVLTVINSPAGKGSVGVFDFSGGSPALVGNARKPDSGQTVTCANPYGYMSYGDGSFEWHRLDE